MLILAKCAVNVPHPVPASTMIVFLVMSQLARMMPMSFVVMIAGPRVILPSWSWKLLGKQ